MMQVAVQLILHNGVVNDAEKLASNPVRSVALALYHDLNHASGSRTSKCLPYIDSPPRPVPVGSPPCIIKSCKAAVADY